MKFLFIVIPLILSGAIINTVDSVPQESAKQLKFIFADTPLLREKGLSGINRLPRDTAMLFVFETNGRHGIWMKDMKFPLDILWLNKMGEIVHIEKNILPETFPKIYSSQVDALYVIEMNAGLAEQLNYEVGSKIILPRL